MRPGIFAKTFARATLEEALDAVAASGVREMQFNLALLGGPSLPAALAPDAARSVRDAVRARGLTMAAVSGTYNMAHPDEAVRRAGGAALAALIAAAPALGTSVVTVCTGTRDPDDMWRGHPDNATPLAWADTLASMAAAASTAEAHGITLGVEPEHGNVVRDARAARRLLDELGSSAVRIVVDAANLVDPAAPGRQAAILREAFALLGDHLVLAHAKDVRADGAVVPAGDGMVDYDLYLELLASAGYAGPLILHGLGEEAVPGAIAFLGERLAGVRRSARSRSHRAGGTTMPVPPIPEGFGTVTPYLAVDDAKAAIDFYERAFGAQELGRMTAPDGSIAHASLQIGDSRLMLSDPFPTQTARSPKQLGGSAVSVFLYVEDTDAVFKRAVEAGATPNMPPADMFWGDRFAEVVDPSGHVWQIATQIEQPSDEEIAERARKAMAGAA